MPKTASPIITDPIEPSRRTAVAAGVFAGALVAGAAAAWYFASLGLTLSHYDARAHLVVARRVIDSLTPGWQQFGGVWLPLPHVLNFLPVQWDWAYRTGAMGTAISVLALSGGLALTARRMYDRSGSVAAALATPALILLNPNILYLQSTPMTEPLLIGLALAAFVWTEEWIAEPMSGRHVRTAWTLAALVLTRYEGWLVAAGLLTVATIATWRRRRRGLRWLWTAPLLAIVGFMFHSYGSTGQWLLSTDFFVPDPVTLHRPFPTIWMVSTGLVALAGPILPIAAAAGVVQTIRLGRRRMAGLLPLALAAVVCLPFLAFYEGHPFRIRYMVPLVAAAGLLAGEAIRSAPSRVRTALSLALLAAVVATAMPLDPNAPMTLEAQWETPFRKAREPVTARLREVYDGTPILASMGSLAHYMHETSASGFSLRDFLHEGNGQLWYMALRSPASFVHWILIEERAEGGDMLALRAASDPGFLSGFDRIAEGGGLALYRRRD